VECTTRHYPELLLRSGPVIYLIECKFNITTGASLHDPEELNKKFQCKIPCDANIIKIIVLPYEIENMNEIASELYKEKIYLYICRDGRLLLYRARGALRTPHMVQNQLSCPDIVCQVCRQCSLLQ
jgi:hypothetical protein